MNNKAHLRPKDYDNNGDIIPMACKEEKGDLISREALKKTFDDTVCIEPMPYAFVKQIIDNAPTVEPPEIQALMSDYLVFRKEERPQGEWLENKDRLGFSYKCSNCGHEMIGRLQDLNYCCKCGADMKGGTE